MIEPVNVEAVLHGGQLVAWSFADGRLMPAIAGGAPGPDDDEDPDEDDPTKGDPDDDDGGDPPTLEAVTADRNKWRGLARKHERDAKKNQAAATELEKLKREQLTATERAEADKKDAEDRASRAERDALVMRVAIRKGVPERLMGRLQGDTEEALEADAEELLTGYREPSEETPESDGTTRRPTPRLRAGGRPNATPVVTDPIKLAEAIPRSAI